MVNLRRAIPTAMLVVCACLINTYAMAEDPSKDAKPAPAAERKPEADKAEGGQGQGVVIMQGGNAEIRVQIQVQNGGNIAVNVDQGGNVVVHPADVVGQKDPNMGRDKPAAKDDKDTPKVEVDKPVVIQIQGGIQVGPGAVAPVKPADPAAQPADAPAEKKDEDLGVSSVYFHVDRDVGARLRKAAQLIAAKKYDSAFDLYLYVLENGPEGLFQLDDNRYLGVRDHCLRSIAALPKDLLAEYRMRVDGDVRRQFDAAKAAPDAAELDALGTKHFLSTPGPEILDLAGDVYAGRGEWARAASCWQRVLRWSGPELASRAMFETKAALALGRMGQWREAREILAGLKARQPDATAVLGGASRKLVDYLDAGLPTSAVTQTATSVGRSHWPQFGGDAAHAARMNERFTCDVKVGELAIPGQPTGTVKPGAVLYDQFGRPTVSTGLGWSPYHPVYADGKVYLHDDTGMMAFRPGGISAEWIDGEMGGQGVRAKPDPTMAMYGMQGASDPRAYACATDDGAVYASLNRAPTGNEIWAVSDKGKRLWTVTKDRAGFDWLAEVTELGDPVFSDGSLYLLAWGNDQFRRECTLICLNAADGELRWRRFLCSGVRMRAYYYGVQGRTLPVLSLPAVEGGVVVVCTNVGGLAGVDARSGDVLWGFAYAQSAINPMAMMMMHGRGRQLPATAADATPLIRDGVAYVMPADADRIYAVEAATGRCAWRAPREDHAQILGVADGRLLVSGKTVEALGLADGTSAWTFDKEGLDNAGAGFLTADALYVPGAKEICLLDPGTGRLLSRLLVSPEGEEWGNLLLVEDIMLQVGKRVHFYGLWNRVYAVLESDIRRDPADPTPHVKLGALYARKDDAPHAIASYERSLRLMTAPDDDAGARRRAEVRRRLYGLYAGEVKRAIDGKDLDAALTNAQRNLAYASDDGTRTQAVLRLADVQARRGDWPGTVAQFQSLIASPPKEVYEFEGGSSMMPALWAQTAIRDLVAKHGRDVYAEFEAEAKRLTEKGQRTDLEQAVARYPNSASALRAMLRLADIDASEGRFRGASRALSDYLRWAGRNAPDAAQVRWRLAHYYERDGQFASARRTLTLLSRDYPDAMVGTGEDRRPLPEAVTAKLAEAPYARLTDREAPAGFGVPLKEAMKVPFGSSGQVTHVGEILIAVDPRGKVRALDARDGRALWTRDVPNGYLSLFVVKGNRLLTGSQNYARLVDVDTGAVLWTYDIPPMRRQIVGANGAVVQVLAGVNVTGADLNEQFVVLAITGSANELVVLDAQTGRPVWKMAPPGQPYWSPILAEDRVIVATNMGFSVYDLATGRKVVDVGNQAARRGMVLLDDGRLVSAEVNRLVCYELESGKAVWSLPCQAYFINNPRFTGSVTVDGKECYIMPTADRKMVCVDLNSGRELWRQPIGGVAEQISAYTADGDSVFVFTAKAMNNERSMRVLALDVRTGALAWAGAPVDGAYPRDWAVGRDYVAILGEVYKIEQQGNNMVQRLLDPVLVCVDRTTGRTAQSLAVKADPNNPGYRPFRIEAVEDTMWAVYQDRMIGLRAEK